MAAKRILKVDRFCIPNTTRERFAAWMTEQMTCTGIRSRTMRTNSWLRNTSFALSPVPYGVLNTYSMFSEVAKPNAAAMRQTSTA